MRIVYADTTMAFRARRLLRTHRVGFTSALVPSSPDDPNSPPVVVVAVADADGPAAVDLLTRDGLMGTVAP